MNLPAPISILTKTGKVFQRPRNWCMVTCDTCGRRVRDYTAQIDEEDGPVTCDSCWEVTAEFRRRGASR